MAIPLSALRRALAEMAAEAGSGARSAYNNEHIVRGYLGGAGGGAVLGGAGGAFIDSPIDGANMGPAGAVTGLAAGALLGATGGGGAKLAHMVINAAREGGRGFSGGLREALAEQAASRGVGRRAAREAADAGDAAAFAQASRGASLDIDQLTSEVARRAALSRNDPAALDEVMRAVEERYGRDVAEEVARRISL